MTKQISKAADHLITMADTDAMDFDALADGLLLSQPTSNEAEAIQAAAACEESSESEKEDCSDPATRTPPSQHVRTLGSIGD